MPEQEVSCSCYQWKPGIEEINRFIIFGSLTHKIIMGEYKGGQFIYCPWCGRRLQKGEVQ